MTDKKVKEGEQPTPEPVEDKIAEGNKAIAEFMGAKFILDWTSAIYTKPFPTFDFGDNRPSKDASRYWSDLQYHTSWDWLMPVVEKIVALDKSKFGSTPSDELRFSAYRKQVTELRVSEPIKTVWLAVVEFITWHQNQNNGK